MLQISLEIRCCEHASCFPFNFKIFPLAQASSITALVMSNEFQHSIANQVLHASFLFTDAIRGWLRSPRAQWHHFHGWKTELRTGPISGLSLPSHVQLLHPGWETIAQVHRNVWAQCHDSFIWTWAGISFWMSPLKTSQIFKYTECYAPGCWSHHALY